MRRVRNLLASPFSWGLRGTMETTAGRYYPSAGVVVWRRALARHHGGVQVSRMKTFVRTGIILSLMSGLVLAVGLLFYKGSGGAVYSDTLYSALRVFLGFYLPLGGIVAGFFLSQWSGSQPSTSSSLFFLISLIVTVLWVVIPIGALYFMPNIEEVLRLLALLDPW